MAFIQNDPNQPNTQPAPVNKFNNLTSLMDLNKNAPNTATKVATNVQGAQQNQQNNVNQATAGIGQAFNYNQQDMDNKVGGNDYEGLQKQLNTTYQGPQAGSVNTAAQNQGQVNQQTQALGSAAGQQQLLKQQYGKSNYTAGEQRMDNMLQGQNMGFQQQAAQAKTQGRKLNNDVNANNNALNMNAATTQQQTEQGVSNLKQGLSNKVQGFQTDAQKAADEANRQDQITQAQAAQTRNDIAGGQVDADTMAQLGLSPDDYTYDVNVGDFVKTTGGGANANNIMSQDTFSKFKNINSLLGNQVDDNKQAGTYQKAQRVLDKEGLQKALGESKQKYEDSFAAQRNSLTGAQNMLSELQQMQAQMQNAPTDGSQNLQNQIAYSNLIKKYGLNGSGGISRNIEWAQKDNLAKAQSAFDQAKATSDSQYLKKLGVKK